MHDTTAVYALAESGGDSRPIEDIVRQIPVSLTGYAFTKINTYARLVSSMIGRPSEVMGLLLGETEGTTATDACLVPGQNVEEWRAYPEGNSFSKAYARAKKDNKKVIGMWHSHGSMHCFHSPDDDTHLRDVLINNTYFLKNRARLDHIATSYASSVVINQNTHAVGPAQLEKGLHYYCCAAIRNEDDEKIIVHNLELDVVEQLSCALDEVILIDEICMNVMHCGEYLKDTKAQASSSHDACEEADDMLYLHEEAAPWWWELIGIWCKGGDPDE
jgi:hypothetical protein